VTAPRTKRHHSTVSQPAKPTESLEMLRAWIHLSAILVLLETLVDRDTEAKKAIEGRELVVQFEVKDGPVAHLDIAAGEITYGLRAHSDPDIRLTFRTPDRLNRLFAGEDVRPGIRKGFWHLRFLLGDFQVLSDRLSYYMEGEGSSPSGDEENLRFLVKMRLQAMLAGTAAIANHDPWMEEIAEGSPAGSMHIRVLPDGPSGFVQKQNGDGEWVGGLSGSGDHANALIEFDNLEAAERLVYSEAGLEEMTSLGEARATGNILIAEKVNELIHRLVSVMGF
jgi:hypothetical protein